MNKKIKKYLDDYFSDVDNFYDDFIKAIEWVEIGLNEDYCQYYYDKVTWLQEDEEKGEQVMQNFKEEIIKGYIAKISYPIKEETVKKNIDEYFKNSDYEWEEMFMNRLAENCYFD